MSQENLLTLGMDCTGESFSVALLRRGQCLGEFNGTCARSHLRLLFPSIKDIYDKLDLTMAETGTVAVTVCPGSFTGLRLGVVTARTMAQVIGCQVAGVDTLEALAANALGIGCVLAGLDARRGEIFAAFFDTSEGEVKRLTPNMVYAPAQLLQALRERKCQAMLGNGPWRYAQELAPGGALLLPEYLSIVRGSCVARLGEAQVAAGDNPDLMSLNPSYLRSAEIQLQGYRPDAEDLKVHA